MLGEVALGFEVVLELLPIKKGHYDHNDHTNGATNAEDMANDQKTSTVTSRTGLSQSQLAVISRVQSTKGKTFIGATMSPGMLTAHRQGIQLQR